MSSESFQKETSFLPSGQKSNRNKKGCFCINEASVTLGKMGLEFRTYTTHG